MVGSLVGTFYQIREISLKKTISNQSLTTLNKVEARINSRPLLVMMLLQINH